MQAGGAVWVRQMTGSAEVWLADAAYDDRSKKYGPGHDPLTRPRPDAMQPRSLSYEPPKSCVGSATDRANERADVCQYKAAVCV